MQSHSSWIKIRDATGEVLKRAPVIVLVSDATASIIYANDAVETVLGFSPEEVLGDRWWQLTRPDEAERARVREFIRRSTSGEEPPDSEPYEEEIKDRNGEIKIIVWRDVVGPGNTLIGVGQDVTERRRVEERLREAKIAAEAAARAKTQFLANMSHEIRTPMNAVTGASSLLLDSRLEPKQRELVEVIRSSSMSLLDLVNDILDFSRIESGAVELEERRLEIRECVEDAVASVAFQASSRGLDLGYELDPALPRILLGDGTRLRQVLINLLSNAVKFTHVGWVYLTVGMGPSLADGRQEVRFSVQDTGIGIKAERRDDIFDVFSQADASTTRRYGGTGLGLAISRRLCEIMGGSLWLEPAEGEGSTFSFSVLVRSPSQDGDSDSVSTSGRFFTAILRQRALFYGLPPASRRTLAAWLKGWGVEIHELTAEALAAGGPDLDLSSLGIDLAFVRLDRPSREGVRVVRALEKAEIPMVGLLMMTEQAKKTRLERLAGQVIAPLRASEIEAALRQVFGIAQLLEVESAQPEATVDPELRVLLGEDNPVNQMIALMMLETLGIRGDVASDGLEVIEALRRDHYDVVLMDVQMPELDGLETTRRIRSELGIATQIIAVTANAMEGDRELCFEAGMDNYISKPFQVETLRSALSKCRRLGPKKKEPEPEAPGSGAGEPCPFMARCPMFPIFVNEPIRRVYIKAYCQAEYTTCRRYALASRGTMPEPRLLPDGTLLTNPGDI